MYVYNLSNFLQRQALPQEQMVAKSAWPVEYTEFISAEG